jgi:hypothetical protein
MSDDRLAQTIEEDDHELNDSRKDKSYSSEIYAYQKIASVMADEEDYLNAANQSLMSKNDGSFFSKRPSSKSSHLKRSFLRKADSLVGKSQQ